MRKVYVDGMIMNKYKQLFLGSQLRLNNLIDDINSGKFNPMSVSKRDYECYLDNQDRLIACNRYVWDFAGLLNLTSQELESIMYSKGSLLIVAHDGRLEFTDYAENGKLQIYGKLAKVTPITLSGVSYTETKSVIMPTGENATDAGAIIMNDFTPYYTGRPQSRQQLNMLLQNDEATVWRQLLNNINLSIKKAIASCENLDQANVIMNQARAILDVDSPIIPIARRKGKDKVVGDIPLELFNFSNNFETQNYCQQIEFYAKKRRQDMGISTPDTFEKKERKITSETEGTNTYAELMLMDGYFNRLEKLNLAKKYFRLKVPNIDSVTVSINPILYKEMLGDDDQSNISV